MLQSYYKLQRTQEDREFYHSHIGYFNLWDEYLILYLGFDSARIIVNRPKTQFPKVAVTAEQNEILTTSLIEHCRERKPEEMFKDFPELENIRLKYI